MAATLDSVGITPGQGKLVAIYDVSEQAVTKVIQRVSLNDPYGNALTIGGPTVTVAPTVTVTTGTGYGVNYCVGGVLTFSNAFNTDTGSGVIKTARLTCQTAQSISFTLFLFNANPVSSAFSDNVVAACSTVDAAKLLMAISLSPDSQLGVAVASSRVETAVNINAANLYGILVSNDTLTRNFVSASDIVVELTVSQDI